MNSRPNSESQRGRHSLYTGKAGEYAVASQLALREVNVLWPVVDEGVDLFTPTGCRIQVKTAHVSATEKMVSQHGEGAYVFPLPRTKRIAITDGKNVLRARKTFADTCDIVVFWGIEQNRFWVVPAYLCDQVQAFVLGPSNERRFHGSLESLREMVRLGYTHQQIADKYNIDRVQVTNHINDLSRTEIKPSAVSRARICEGAWHLITEFDRNVPVVAPELPNLLVEREGA